MASKALLEAVERLQRVSRKAPSIEPTSVMKKLRKLEEGASGLTVIRHLNGRIVGCEFVPSTR